MRDPLASRPEMAAPPWLVTALAQLTGEGRGGDLDSWKSGPATAGQHGEHEHGEEHG
ncbi:hypothetical protein [Streptomyces sp. MNU89]|uniref:hypothetical protein n=1 Tax=Streptomyces sp. MNU89 TaxID=2560025 RepID=UPI001E4EB6EE|nr:hypothetical protein [Streptomyces sp. MNU89]MCC9738402.1 hypothetical protein [Streptomyces sp. MNU89]